MSAAIELDAKLDLPAASALKVAFSNHEEQEIIVDFSEVKHLGALCLQVLLSAARTARTEGRSMQIINVPDRVVDQMRVMGVTPETIAGVPE